MTDTDALSWLNGLRLGNPLYWKIVKPYSCAQRIGNVRKLSKWDIKGKKINPLGILFLSPQINMKQSPGGNKSCFIL